MLSRVSIHLHCFRAPRSKISRSMVKVRQLQIVTGLRPDFLAFSANVMYLPHNLLVVATQCVLWIKAKLNMKVTHFCMMIICRQLNIICILQTDRYRILNVGLETTQFFLNVPEFVNCIFFALSNQSEPQTHSDVYCANDGKSRIEVRNRCALHTDVIDLTRDRTQQFVVCGKVVIQFR